MGWDAFSSAPLSKSKGAKLKHKKHREAFAQAAANVRKHTDTVDGFLEAGALDCSACRNMMEKAVENTDWHKDLSWGTAWREEGMPPEIVKEMHRELNWAFKVHDKNLWAYWSAREFVRVCADMGLSIRFTY